MYKDAPEDAIPLCTDEDLWRKETTWKYYKTKIRLMDLVIKT